VRGISVPGENEYLGIPYAAPPVGALRWLPPQKPVAFHRQFRASQFGNVCPQRFNGGGSFIGNEDCLNLNVYVPSGKAPDDGFPVMVWIHGGGLTFGAGSFYDPTRLVETGRVIVVTINYRLGLLGFFAHPAIDAEGHTNANYGLMDQQFALKWVKRNIEGFGGNPKRVTIFGESAGGFSVFSNLASPTAAGLFQGAISESGGYYHYQVYFDEGAFLATVVPLAAAETAGSVWVSAGTTIASILRCGGGNLTAQAQCLRSLFANQVVRVNPGLAFPIIDGVVLTQTLDASFTSGAFNHVPVISGTNHDEARLFVAEQYDFGVGALTDAEYPGAVAAYVGYPVSDPYPQYLVNFEYPLTNYPPPPPYTVSAPLALSALWGDVELQCTTRNADLLLSQTVPTYVYEFNDETAPPWFNASSLSFPLGDAHFIEVEYLFNLQSGGGGGGGGSSGVSFTPNQQQLSDTMIGYWARFAKTGNPNSAGAPTWPLYSSGSLESLVAPTPVNETDASFDADHKCSGWWNTLP
jgi:para-nitrobenzyl esterase